jgi:hypothetical protein
MDGDTPLRGARTTSASSSSPWSLRQLIAGDRERCGHASVPIVRTDDRARAGRGPRLALDRVWSFTTRCRPGAMSGRRVGPERSSASMRLPPPTSACAVGDRGESARAPRVDTMRRPRACAALAGTSAATAPAAPTAAPGRDRTPRPMARGQRPHRAESKPGAGSESAAPGGSPRSARGPRPPTGYSTMLTTTSSAGRSIASSSASSAARSSNGVDTSVASMIEPSAETGRPRVRDRAPAPHRRHRCEPSLFLRHRDTGDGGRPAPAIAIPPGGRSRAALVATGRACGSPATVR